MFFVLGFLLGALSVIAWGLILERRTSRIINTKGQAP